MFEIEGLLAGSDAEVLAAAYSEDRLVVTSNVDDFLALARAADLHGGFVLVEDGDLVRDEQEQVLRRAITAIEQEYEAGRDFVNRVMFVDRSGKLEVRDVTPG